MHERNSSASGRFCQVWRQRNEFWNLLARAGPSTVDRDCVIAGLLSILLTQASLVRALPEPSEEVLATVRDTPMNPVVAASFMLAIVASEGPPAFPDLPGHAPDVAKARRDRARIALTLAELRKAAPDGGAYVAESSYFQPDWQLAYWGPNYDRLRAVKARYDPDGLFFVRHGVGSEGWSEDGFDRLA